MVLSQLPYKVDNEADLEMMHLWETASLPGRITSYFLDSAYEVKGEALVLVQTTFVC